MTLCSSCEERQVIDDDNMPFCEWCIRKCDCGNLDPIYHTPHTNGMVSRILRMLTKGGTDKLKQMIVKPSIRVDVLRAIIKGHMPEMLSTFDKIILLV